MEYGIKEMKRDSDRALKQHRESKNLFKKAEEKSWKNAIKEGWVRIFAVPSVVLGVLPTLLLINGQVTA